MFLTWFTYVLTKLKDDPKVMAHPNMFGMKEKKFSHIRGLSLNPEVYVRLKSS